MKKMNKQIKRTNKNRTTKKSNSPTKISIDRSERDGERQTDRIKRRENGGKRR